MASAAQAWAVIVAAGRGQRFGSDELKQFVPLAGKPMALWAMDPFCAHPSILGVTLVVPAEYVDQPHTWLGQSRRSGVEIISGGAERTDSVRLGVETVPDEVQFVAIHDGARPLISEGIISRVLAAAQSDRGVIAARRMADTVKEVDESGRVVRTVNRGSLWRAETPQLFPRQLILDVLRRAQNDGVHASDCAALLERYGIEAVVVEVADLNLKVTTPDDLEIAEAWLRQHETSPHREPNQ